MQKTNEMRDLFINEFAENYMEKLFYFCLKKTGSHIEAEDLTQDIALQIITALNKGTIPTSFSAWVWQITRNRYSVWAKEKHNRNESVTGSDISDLLIVSMCTITLIAVMNMLMLNISLLTSAKLKKKLLQI